MHEEQCCEEAKNFRHGQDWHNHIFSENAIGYSYFFGNFAWAQYILKIYNRHNSGHQIFHTIFSPLEGGACIEKSFQGVLYQNRHTFKASKRGLLIKNLSPVLGSTFYSDAAGETTVNGQAKVGTGMSSSNTNDELMTLTTYYYLYLVPTNCQLYKS